MSWSVNVWQIILTFAVFWAFLTPPHSYTNPVHSFLNYGHLESFVSKTLQWCLRDCWYKLLFLKEQFSEQYAGELHCFQIAIVGHFFCVTCYSFWWFFDVANKLNSSWKINYKLGVFWAVHTVFVSSSSICSKCITGTDTKKEGVCQLSPQSGFWTVVLLPDLKCYCIKHISKSWSFTDDQYILMIR